MISPKKWVMKHYFVEGGIILFKFNGFYLPLSSPEASRTCLISSCCQSCVAFVEKLGFRRICACHHLEEFLKQRLNIFGRLRNDPTKEADWLFFHHKILSLYTRTCIYSINMPYTYIYIPAVSKGCRFDTQNRDVLRGATTPPVSQVKKHLSYDVIGMEIEPTTTAYMGKRLSLEASVQIQEDWKKTWTSNYDFTTTRNDTHWHVCVRLRRYPTPPDTFLRSATTPPLNPKGCHSGTPWATVPNTTRHGMTRIDTVTFDDFFIFFKTCHLQEKNAL